MVKSLNCQGDFEIHGVYSQRKKLGRVINSYRSCFSMDVSPIFYGVHTEIALININKKLILNSFPLSRSKKKFQIKKFGVMLNRTCLFKLYRIQRLCTRYLIIVLNRSCCKTCCGKNS